jgi:uncharacterized protein (TIGR04255 family)
MGNFYQNPPLIEALCEFQFESGQPWDWTIPGLVYQKVKHEFPKKKQQNVIEMEARVEQDEFMPSIKKGGVARLQFLREDETALLQVGPNLFVVNHLKPYPTWSKFQKMIQAGLAVYCEVAKPQALKRVSLRYINRLEIPQPQVEIEDYILAVPKIPTPVPQVFATWIQRVEIPFESSNGLMVIQSGLVQPHNPKTIVFLLDLDFMTIDIQKINLDNVMDWITQAHDDVEKSFEACVTDKMRALMKEVRND